MLPGRGPALVVTAALFGPLFNPLFSPLAHGQAEEPADLIGAFQKHCVSCHGGDRPKASIDLTRFESADDLGREPELLEKVIEVLRSGDMPPEEEPRPDEAELGAWIGGLEGLLDEVVASGSADRTSPLRRMNRFEYGNAVRDLFELDVNLFSLPEAMVRPHGDYFQPASGVMPDRVKVGNRSLGKSQLIEKRLHGVNPFPRDLRAEHGYNNRGDHLSLSPILMESFLALGQSIVQANNLPEHCGIWDRFFAAPDGAPEEERAIASARLEPFLRRAFRGSVSEETLDRYLGHFDALAARGLAFEDRMRALASAALVSPRFLYVYDGLASEVRGAVTDLELASRLSFYLWSSLPDGELLDLAEEGRLSDPEVLRGQVERMTRHPHIKRFCDSFPAQWLNLDLLVGARPDRDRFPGYYFAAFGKFVFGMHMQLEPLLLFEACFIEDRPVAQLIDPEFTYRTDPLDDWYRLGAEAKIPNQPAVITYKRRPLTDRRFGGVITNAAVLTMTSSPLRTQPITRGAWIASVIFNDPPDPPPAVVPALDADDEAIEAAGKTVRERLMAHRTNPECASCHRSIDPLGFALEQYDPVGQWRESYRTGLPIDASGSLFGRREFTDAVSFKDAVLEEEAVFTQALAEHLLAYALGREVGPADRDAIQWIVDTTRRRGGGLRTLIEQVALSPALTGRPVGAAPKATTPSKR